MTALRELVIQEQKDEQKDFYLSAFNQNLVNMDDELFFDDLLLNRIKQNKDFDVYDPFYSGL